MRNDRGISVNKKRRKRLEVYWSVIKMIREDIDEMSWKNPADKLDANDVAVSLITAKDMLRAILDRKRKKDPAEPDEPL